MRVAAKGAIYATWLMLAAIAVPAAAAEPYVRLAAGPPQAKQDAQKADDGDGPEPTLEEKYRKRFPQPVRVGDLIGLPVLDFNDSTIGYVKDVVRRPDGEIDLIVPYRAWLGWQQSEWGRRPVAIPLKAVAKLALQLNALEFTREDFEEAKPWSPAEGTAVGRDEKVFVALGRR